MNDKHIPAMWQARPVSGGGWREVSPTKQEPTVQQRVDYLRTVQNRDGTPAYEFRALVESTPLADAAPDLLAALKSIAAIKNEEFGSDWDEIERARDIAREAIFKATGEAA